MKFVGIVLGVCVLCGMALAEEFFPEAYDPSQITAEMKAQTDTIATALEGIAPSGWKQVGVVERYTPVNMYGKINGRSELFMSYGVIGMTWTGLVAEDDADLSIEVFLYDQGSPLSAFGVYGVERWQESTDLEIGDEAYRTDTDLFFRKGNYYVTLIGSDETEGIKKAQLELAKHLAGRLAENPEPLWGDKALPSKGRVKHSLKYFLVDAMSLDFMKNTFVCDVEAEGKVLTHFVSRQFDEEAAKKALESYEKYLTSYGGGGAMVEHEGGRLLVGDAGGGYHDVVFVHGKDLAGVTAVQDKEAAIRAAVALRAHLITE